MSIRDAEAAFDKAMGFDAKASDSTKSEGVQRMARKAVDKHLGQAVELEAAAVAAGERHGEDW